MSSLTAIQSELKNVKNDIDEIIDELRKFKGIGENVCINKLYSFKEDCQLAIKEIENVKEIREEVLRRKEAERLRELENERKLKELLEQGKIKYS